MAGNRRPVTKENDMNKFVALKIDGLKYWVWFEIEKVKEADGRVVGKSGWGKNGEFTEIDVPDGMIKARIYSRTLAY